MEIQEFRRIRDFKFLVRTDLWISLSKAKFDDEPDFEVHLAVALRKPCQISENQNLRRFFDPKFLSKILFEVEKRNVGNRPKRV